MPGLVRNYRELTAWQRAMDLVEIVYAVSRAWPREELYGLTGQIRRAAVSIPSNIAEGQGRASTKEYLHHLSIAHGSLREVETQILIAQRLGYHSAARTDEVLAPASEVGKLVHTMFNTLSDRVNGNGGVRR